LGVLAAGASSTVSVVYRVPETVANGTVNVYTVSVGGAGAASDPNTGNNVASDVTTVVARADVSVVSVSDGESVVGVGDGASHAYTSVIANNGPSQAQNVVVTQVVPSEFVVGGAVALSGASGSCVVSGQTVTCSLGAMSSGQVATLVVPYTVPAAAAAGSVGSTVSSVTSVTSTTSDPVPGNNQGTDATQIGAADVTVTISDAGYDPVSNAAGTLVRFTVTASNLGNVDAANVEATVTLPAGLTFVSTSCVGGTAAVLCPIGVLGSGASTTFEVVASVNGGQASGTVVTTGASVTTSSLETNSGNNNAAASTTLTGAAAADLRVGLTDNVVGVVAGEGVVRAYTTTVTNGAGGAAADSVTVVQVIPDGFVIQGVPVASQGTCSVSGQTVTCVVGNMAAGGAPVTVVAQYVVSVSAAAGDAVSTASATAATAPVLVPGANVANDTDVVSHVADVSVTVTDNTVGGVVAGDGVGRAYTIVVRNEGPSTATGVTVSQTGAVATGVTLGAASGVAGCTALPCAIGSLAPGASVTVVVPYVVEATATGSSYQYNVSVASTSSDPAASNNEASDLTGLSQVVDLEVTVTDAADPVALSSGGTATLVYTVAVRNTGVSALSGGGSVAVTLPAGMSGASVSGGVTGCVAGGGGFTGCVIPALAAAGGSFSFTVSGSVSAAGGFTLSAAATAAAPQTESNPGNNADSETTTVVAFGAPAADLEISKQDGVASVSPGASGVYTVVVLNKGPSATSGSVVVTDTWPAGQLTQSGGAIAATSGGVCAFVTASELRCTFTASIGVGATEQVTIPYVVSATAAGPTVSNVAKVESSANPDPDPSNNERTDSNAVDRVADLAVVVSDSVSQVTAGEGVLRTYVIVVTNLGPDAALVTPVSAPGWPVGLEFVSATAATGSCNGLVYPVVSCDLGVLAAGASSTVSVVYRVPETVANGTVNVYTVSVGGAGAASDPNTGNNVASDVTTVVARADVSVVSVSDGESVVGVGDGASHAYTSVIANNGPSQAQNVVVTQVVPSEFVVGGAVALSGASGSCVVSGQTVTCSLGAMSSGQVATLVVPYTVPAAAAAGSVGSTVSSVTSVTSTTSDPVPGNNQGTDATQIGAADVTVTISDAGYDPVSNAAGTLVRFTVTASNLGNVDAANVEATVTLPAGLTFVSTSCVGGTAAVLCPIGVLGSGASTTFEVVASVNGGQASGTVVTTGASVTTSSLETNSGNNNAAASTTLTGAAAADLRVGLTDNVVGVVAGEGVVRAYTTTVTNGAGGAAADSVTVVQVIPDGFVIQGVPVASQGTCSVSGQTVTCVVGNMAAGGAPVTVVAQYVVSVSAAAGDAVSTASATAATAPVLVPGANVANDTDVVSHVADVSVTVTDNTVGGVVAGDGVGRAYTIVVRNEGPSTATGVTVSQTGAVATGVTLGAASGVAGCTALPCAIGSLAPGASVTVVVPYVVEATATGSSYQYNVSVASTSSDPAASNNEASDLTGLSQVVDLEVTVTDAADPVALSSGGTATLVYTVAVRNTGVSALSGGGSVAVTLPAGMSGASVSGGVTGCVAGGGGFTGCVIPALAAAGGSFSFTVSGSVSAAGGFTLSAAATAAAPQTESNPGNNADSETTTVVAFGAPAADLEISKQDGVASVSPGASGVYTVVVLNKGPSATSGSVVVTDTWPAGQLTQSGGAIAATSGGVCAFVTASELRCTFTASIGVGATEQVTIPYVVSATAAGPTVSNVAKVESSANPDPDPSNNERTDSNAVVLSILVVLVFIRLWCPMLARLSRMMFSSSFRFHLWMLFLARSRLLLGLARSLLGFCDAILALCRLEEEFRCRFHILFR
jgi:uncharacterized repeat protein (TIGR01451 family)